MPAKQPDANIDLVVGGIIWWDLEAVAFEPLIPAPPLPPPPGGRGAGVDLTQPDAWALLGISWHAAAFLRPAWASP